MKKSFLFLVALSCALFLFTGCPDPDPNPEIPAENPTTDTNNTDISDGTSTDTPDTVTVCGMTFELPAITIPELPTYSGNDIFAGKSFYTKNYYADGYVFGTDGTVTDTRLANIEGSLQGRSDYVYGRYEYSYDSNHLYMRRKSVHYVDEAGTESCFTPQEYLKVVFTDCFGNEWEEETKEMYTESKTECDEQSGGSTFEDFVKWYILCELEAMIDEVESLQTYDVVEGVIRYQYTQSVYNPETQQSQLQSVTRYYSPFLSSDEDPFKDNTYEDEYSNRSFQFGNDGTVCEYFGTNLYATYSYKCNSNYIYLACITRGDINTQTGEILKDDEGNYILVSNSTYWEHYSSYMASLGYGGYNMEYKKSELTILSYEDDTITTDESLGSATYTLVED